MRGGGGAYAGDETAKTVTALGNLTDDFGTGRYLRCFSEKTEEIMSNFEGTFGGVLTHLICQWPYNLSKLHYNHGTYPAPPILFYPSRTDAGRMCSGCFVWCIWPMRTFMLYLIPV